MTISIYGRLEELAKQNYPSRSDVCFVLCTLANSGHSEADLLDFIYTQTNWHEYSTKKNKNVNGFVKLSQWAVSRTKKNNLFSPSKESSTELKQKVKEWFFDKGWVRTTYENEVALDIDSKKQFDLDVRFFKEKGFKGNCRTWKDAKGGHISLFFDEPVTAEFRKKCKFVFGADPNSINTSVIGKPHQKTENLVYIVAENL